MQVMTSWSEWVQAMADDDGLFVEDDVEEPTRCGHKRPRQEPNEVHSAMTDAAAQWATKRVCTSSTPAMVAAMLRACSGDVSEDLQAATLSWAGAASARSVVQLMKRCDGQIGSTTHQMLLGSVAEKVKVLEDAAAKAEAEALHRRCAAAEAALVCERRRGDELTSKASEAMKLLASVVGPRPEELVAVGD